MIFDQVMVRILVYDCLDCFIFSRSYQNYCLIWDSVDCCLEYTIIHFIFVHSCC